MSKEIVSCPTNDAVGELEQQVSISVCEENVTARVPLSVIGGLTKRFIQVFHNFLMERPKKLSGKPSTVLKAYIREHIQGIFLREI